MPSRDMAMGLKIFRSSSGASAARAALGPLESDVMEALWALGKPSSVSEVADLIRLDREISYSAIKAVLNNLTDKKHCKKAAVNRKSVFEPVLTRNQFEEMVLTSVVRSLKENFGGAALAHLVAEFGSDEEDLEHFERLIALRKLDLTPE